MKPIKIKREELLKIKGKIRREIDVADGVGINNKRQVFVDKRKKLNKELARKKIKLVNKNNKFGDFIVCILKKDLIK